MTEVEHGKDERRDRYLRKKKKVLGKPPQVTDRHSAEPFKRKRNIPTRENYDEY